LNSSYILGKGGEQVSELNGSNTWQHTNVYADGRLFATYNTINPSTPHYHFSDWLGSRRVQAGGASGGSEETCWNQPFGDNLVCAGSGTDATEHHFTGKERDTESGNDYFGARYYGSTMGRFMSPDWTKVPEGIPYADLSDPQSLNLYSYTKNNPLTRIDADGHCDWGFESSHCGAGSLLDAMKADMGAWNTAQQPYDMGLWLDDPNFDKSDGMARTTYEYKFVGGDGSRYDRDKQYAALAAGLGSAKEGESPEDIAKEIQHIYDNLTPYTGANPLQVDPFYDENGHAGLHGGNWNFSSDVLSGLGFNQGRNGLIPSVHLEGDHFHVDTSNGASIVGPIHWIVDKLLGTYYPDFHDNGIPR
jgi:RHS repeat-associated protein